jgi:hypothetical protein
MSVIVFNNNSDKYLYLLDYLQEQGIIPKVIDVNVASTLEDWFDSIRPAGQKVFLPFSYEDLSQDKELLRQKIQGLETKGWRNLIVLPFEGMTDKSIAERVRDLGLKFVQDKFVQTKYKHEFNDKPVFIHGKLDVKAVKEKTDWGMDKPYVEVQTRGGIESNRVQEQLKDIHETIIDPDDEMKEESGQDKFTGIRQTKEELDEAKEKTFDTSIDLSKLPEDKSYNATKREEADDKDYRKKRRKIFGL